MEFEQVLKLLKYDLGVSGNQRDEYLLQCLSAANSELARKGVVLDLTAADDVMLLSDYTAYKYRHRTDDAPLPKNIQLRIRNRDTKSRSVIV